MGILERKLKEKESRRKAIIDAACNTFYQNGFNVTTIDKIANVAQLSKGTIYLYFKSKDDIYLHLILDAYTILLNMVKDANLNDLPVDEKLLLITDKYYEFSKKHKEFFKFIQSKNFIVSENSSLENQELISNINNIEYEIFQILTRIIQQGINSGIFIKEINSEYLVLQMWASLTGAIETLKQNLSIINNPDISIYDIINDITKTFIICYAKSSFLKEKYFSKIKHNSNLFCKNEKFINLGVI